MIQACVATNSVAGNTPCTESTVTRSGKSPRSDQRCNPMVWGPSHTISIPTTFVTAKGHEKKKRDTFPPLLSSLLLIIAGNNVVSPLLTVVDKGRQNKTPSHVTFFPSYLLLIPNSLLPCLTSTSRNRYIVHR